jgi:hypothetical protein
MNTKMKTVSIALTGGILLGWGASATLAENVVGVSYFGLDEAQPSYFGDNAADIISWNPDTGIVTLQYGQENGLNMQSGENGRMIGVTIDAAGSGYLVSDEAVQTVDNTDLTGLDAQWSYSVDGVIGTVDTSYVSFNRNEMGFEMVGTGYVSADVTGVITTEFYSTWAFDQDCPGGTDFAVGDFAAFGGAPTAGIQTAGDAANPCQVTGRLAGTVGTAAGEICDLFVGDSGVGYGIAGIGGDMMIYNNGVLSEDYTATYTINGDGGIDVVTMVLNGAPVDIELMPTNWDQITMVPEGNGFGFDYELSLWGEVTDLDNLTPGLLCESVEFAAVPLQNGCTDCGGTLPDGMGASVSLGVIPSGAITEAAIVDKGFNYDAAPAISIDDSTFAAPHTGDVARFSAVMGSDAQTLSYADGATAEFMGDWKLAYNDFNQDGIADIVAYDRDAGLVYIATMTIGFVIAELNEVGSVGSGWEIVGTLDNNLEVGASIFWRNQSSGANAVWVCNTDSLTNGGVVKQPESDYVEAASNGWYSNVTNSEFNVLWYNPASGLQATWGLSIDTTMPAADWVVSNEYLANGGLIYNIGSDHQWILDGVGFLSGSESSDADGVSNNDDLVWVNANNGGVALWIMDGNAITSQNYATIGGVTYNGVEAGTTVGNRIVGVGFYFAPLGTRISVGTAPEIRSDAVFSSLWWNRSGDSYVWSMDRTMSLQDWTIDGNTNDGTGLLANPDNVRSFQRY